MTNVIPFRQPTPPAKPYLLLTTLIDPNAALEFVTKGSPEEYYDLDGLKYRVKDLAPNRADAPHSLKILGRVMAAKDLRERLTPAS
jgi:hypothetical protein